jgi:hypothetical protein
MKIRAWRVWLVVASMVLMVMACGEKEEKTVYSGSEGELTVTQGANGQNDKVTMTGQDGTVTMEYGKAALPDDLGIARYPGASAAEGGTLQVQGEGGGEAVVSVTMHSADAIDKVARFYKKQLADRQPRVFEMTLPTGKMVTFTMEWDNVVRTVVLNEDDRQGGTTIQISRVRE